MCLAVELLVEHKSEMEEKAKQFWKSQTTYPRYGTIKQRRLHELNYLVPKLKDVKSLLDLGCGDGALIKCLTQLTDIEKYYAYDIAENLMKDIPAETQIYDCQTPSELPTTDFTVFAGVIPFLFEDEEVHAVLNKINSPIVYVKAPCSMIDQDIEVDGYSEKLGQDYASIYRTVEHMLFILNEHFDIEEIARAYPDEIESEFGTKQMIFLCKSKVNHSQDSQ